MIISKENKKNLCDNSLPLVSICLLTYQHAEYIGSCIQGILSQNYPYIELIVLDDASTDDTVEIIESFEDRLKKRGINFLFIKHSVNSGNIPANCNEMLQQSHGKYIKMYSGDDILLEDCISSLVSLMENKGCSVAYCNAFIINNAYKYGERYGKEKLLKNHREIPKERVLKKLHYGNIIPSPTAMIRKDIYSRYGFYDENIGYEDYDLWLRLAGKETFCYLDRMLYLYRKSDTGLSNCNTRFKFRFLYNQTIQILKKHLMKVSDEERQKVILHFYKEWAERAKQKCYIDIFICIEFRLFHYAVIMWLRGHRNKNCNNKI